MKAYDCPNCGFENEIYELEDISICCGCGNMHTIEEVDNGHVIVEEV